VEVFGAMIASEDETLDVLTVIRGNVCVPGRCQRRLRPDRGNAAARAPAPPGLSVHQVAVLRRATSTGRDRRLRRDVRHPAPGGRGAQRRVCALGGAYNRPAPQATAFAHRDQLFSIEHIVVVDPSARKLRKRLRETGSDRRTTPSTRQPRQPSIPASPTRNSRTRAAPWRGRGGRATAAARRPVPTCGRHPPRQPPEDLDAAFELGARELFGPARHVHGLGSADGHRRVEDRDRDLRPGGNVP
jgi:hypothetical protein